jgi:ABC-type multidrug transport system ATPase subunit
MQQKVAITRALLINPPLLLLDEPTTGLDPKSRRDVQTFLERLRSEEGTTILLTSHDMAETERLCARIGFLAHGRLIAEGTARELKSRSGTGSLDDAFIALAGEKLEDGEAEAVKKPEAGAARAEELKDGRAPAERPEEKDGRGETGDEVGRDDAGVFEGEEVLQEER